MEKQRSSFPLRYALALLVLLGIALAAGAYYINQAGARPAETATVTRGDLKATVTANGRLRAVTSARLAFPLSGLVTRVNVVEGSAVKAGDVLAELDRGEAQRRVQQAEATVAARQDELDAAQEPPTAAALELANQTLKRAALVLANAEDRYTQTPNDDNRAAKELAQIDYDIARANFDRQTAGPTDTELDRLRRAVENARLDAQNAREALDQTQLKAPFDGLVTEVNAHPAELLGAYNPAITVADTTRLELTADIDEIDVAAVQEGQAVELRFDAFPGESAQGTLTRLFPAAVTDRGATVYRAVIALAATPLHLRPGMGATVNIATVEKKNVLRLPTRAIKSAGTQKIVALRGADGTARNIVIETGLSDGNETEIVSGLQEGAVVLLE